MASLLDGTNAVLKRTGKIDVEGELTSLTVEAKQVWIDLTIQLWNETIDHLYSKLGEPRPNILAQNSITLATSDRDYGLETDLVRMHFPLLDETNGRYIVEYPGGFQAIINDQPHPANFTGLPIAGAIRPTDGQLYLDRIPTANENGLEYQYWYEKDASLAAAADTMPFTDAVFRALVPAVAQLFRLEQQGREAYTQAIYRASMGRAARLVRTTPPRDSWTPRDVPQDNTDPLNA